MFKCDMSRYLVYAFLALMVGGGCNKGDVTDLVDKVKQTASESTEKVKEAVSEQVGNATGEMQEQLQLAGSIELQLDQMLSTQACYVQFLQQGSGRPNVLQLQSYRSAEDESFPSVFLRAQVSATSAQELVGQVAAARLFVQPQQDGPTWYSAVGSPVEVQVVSIDDQMLTAELVGGTLENTAHAETGVTGTFQAVFR